jgi:hypothetical protein
MNWSVCSYWGENNIGRILFISPVADSWDPVSLPQGTGMQVYDSLSGCRAHGALHGGWATYSALGLQTQHPHAHLTQFGHISPWAYDLIMATIIFRVVAESICGACPCLWSQWTAITMRPLAEHEGGGQGVCPLAQSPLAGEETLGLRQTLTLCILKYSRVSGDPFGRGCILQAENSVPGSLWPAV